MPISAPRSDLSNASSKVGAIAITSPVAFICGPSVRVALLNLSKGQRGIFTTT